MLEFDLFMTILQELQDAHQVFKANMSAAQEEFENIMAISQKIESLSDQENPYTSLSKEVKNILEGLL